MRNKYLGMLAVAGFGVIAGCNNDKLTSVNNNPNSPVDVPAPAIFTDAARVSVGAYVGNGYDLRGLEWVSQHLAEVDYPDEDDYKRLLAAAGTTPGWFDNTYESQLEDLRKVVQKGQSAKDASIWAPASIMQVWNFSYLTNTFGDVPYFQALTGDSLGSTYSPKYDAQKDIYTDMFSRLDAASKALSGAGNGLGKADPIYAGVPTAWQKFANSLRLRLAMQLSNVDPATASAQVQAALAAPGGVFTSNADMAELVWPGDGVYNNPWSVNFQSRDDHRMSNTLMNIMLASNDPRIPIYAQPTVADPTKYAGMPNGLTQSTAQPYTNISSRPGLMFWPPVNSYGVVGGTGVSTPSFIMTYAEVAFLEAEAAARNMGGLNSGEAQGFYNAAITSSLQQWGVNDAGAISTFLANPAIAYKGGTAGQIQIATQEWVGLYTDGGQAWALWRRTCQPATLVPGPDAIINTVPRRMQYSTTELQVNASAVSAALAAMGGPDVFQTRMYWDTNPTAAPTYPGASCGTRS